MKIKFERRVKIAYIINFLLSARKDFNLQIQILQIQSHESSPVRGNLAWNVLDKIRTKAFIHSIIKVFTPTPDLCDVIYKYSITCH